MIASQEEGIEYRIEQCEEKISNMRQKMKRLSNHLKIEGCITKMEKLEKSVKELKNQLIGGAEKITLAENLSMHL
jgi:chaperonin cofactor prefoldin